MEPAPKLKLREPFIILVLIFLGIFWTINALNTGNIFWFLPILSQLFNRPVLSYATMAKQSSCSQAPQVFQSWPRR